MHARRSFKKKMLYYAPSPIRGDSESKKKYFTVFNRSKNTEFISLIVSEKKEDISLTIFIAPGQFILLLLTRLELPSSGGGWKKKASCAIKGPGFYVNAWTKKEAIRCCALRSCCNKTNRMIISEYCPMISIEHKIVTEPIIWKVSRTTSRTTTTTLSSHRPAGFAAGKKRVKKWTSLKQF